MIAMRSALFFLALSLAFGVCLFGKSRESGWILEIAFVVSVCTFLASLVILIAKRAERSVSIRDESDSGSKRFTGSGRKP